MNLDGPDCMYTKINIPIWSKFNGLCQVYLGYYYGMPMDF